MWRATTLSLRLHNISEIDYRSSGDNNTWRNWAGSLLRKRQRDDDIDSRLAECERNLARLSCSPDLINNLSTTELETLQIELQNNMRRLNDLLHARSEEERQNRQCPVCLDNEAKEVLIPCGHFLCAECAQDLIQRRNLRCPICRQNIRRTNNTYRGRIDEKQKSQINETMTGRFHNS